MDRRTVLTSTQDLNTLKTKFQEMRKVVSTMPGIHLSPEQQQQQLQRLRAGPDQERTAAECKSLCMFEIPKGSEPARECWGTGVLSPSPVEMALVLPTWLNFTPDYQSQCPSWFLLGHPRVCCPRPDVQ